MDRDTVLCCLCGAQGLCCCSELIERVDTYSWQESRAGQRAVQPAKGHWQAEIGVSRCAALVGTRLQPNAGTASTDVHDTCQCSSGKRHGADRPMPRLRSVPAVQAHLVAAIRGAQALALVWQETGHGVVRHLGIAELGGFRNAVLGTLAGGRLASNSWLQLRSIYATLCCCVRCSKQVCCSWGGQQQGKSARPAQLQLHAGR